MMSKLNCIAVLFLLWSIGVEAQDRSGIRLLAKVRNDSILLRWAPTDHILWQYANKSGYTVERFTITRGTTLLPSPERVLLTPAPLKPAPVERWEEPALRNDYAAIAAEAIYSSSFDVTAPSNSVFDVVNRTREQEQRFSFALFSADHSFETALLSGLAFADADVKPEEKYLYRVYMSSPDSRVKPDTAFFYISLQDTLGLPVPIGLQAEFRNRAIRLSWPKIFLQGAYSSFVIERADEADKTFRRINKSAFINFDDDDDRSFHYVDSLPANGVTYSFRIRGVDAFGELGPPSDPASGAGFDKLKAMASIFDGREISPGRVQVEWKFTGEVKTIRQIYLQRAGRVDGKYDNVNAAPIAPGSTRHVDERPLPTSYYRVKLVGERDSLFSFPYLVQLLDSIPPKAPEGLTGIIDTTGVVTIKWKQNSENDLLGYRVFRSNFAAHEFSQLTSDPALSEIFVDTIEIRSMTKDVYYKVVAVDKRHNPSQYSVVLRLTRPDVLPPAPPAIKSIRQTDNHVEINWLKSPSDDVKAYAIVRRPARSNEWQVMKEFAADITSYADPVEDNQGDYEYSVIAVDEAGNRSIVQRSVVIHIIPAETESITGITYSVDRNNKSISLRWKKSPRDVAKYVVYRAADGEPLSLYKSIQEQTDTFIDKNLVVNKEYRYRFKAVHSDGRESPFSKEVRVKF